MKLQLSRISGWAVLAVALPLTFTLAAAAQAAPPSTGPQLIVTVLGSHNEGAPAIAASQVEVRQGHDHVAVTGWKRFGNGRVDLVVALDDDTANLGSRLDDIKDFINHLPANVAVGVVYLRTGTVEIAQAFTPNHALAVKALRMPAGANVSPSPFSSIEALMAKWPRHADRRREMVLFTDGTEHLGGNDSNNQTVQKAVSYVVQEGVVVYTILVSGAAKLTAGDVSSTGSVNASDGGGAAGGVSDAAFPGSHGGGFGAAGAKMGQNQATIATAVGSENLSMLAQATGGQAFSEGSRTPTRFAPYLDEVTRCLQSQYQLTFTPASGTHGPTGIKIEVQHSPAKIIAPQQAFIPGS